MRDYSKIEAMLDRELDAVEERGRLDLNLLNIMMNVLQCKLFICKMKKMHREHHEEDALIEDVEARWDENIPTNENDLRWYNKMMNEAKTEEERAMITQLMNLKQSRA